LAVLLPSLSNERTLRALIAPSPLLAPPLLSPKTIDRRSLAIGAQPPHAERARTPTVHLASNGMCWRWSLVFDPRPTQAERSLRPSEIIIRQVSSAAAAWVFELRLLRRISGIAPSTMPAKSEIEVSWPRHQINAITASLST